MSDVREWMDTKAAADYLGVKPYTLVNWRVRKAPGSPPYAKIANLVRYSKTDLDAHLRKSMVSFDKPSMSDGERE